MKVAAIVMLTILGGLDASYASPQISIATDKSEYEYGQDLSFSISVSQVTGDFATLEIMDQSGHSSSPIHLAITRLVSNITAPIPFYRTTFLPGKYYVNMQYSGSNATTSFQIVDIGKIAIPPQFKEVADSWSRGETSDKLFGKDILYLIQSGIIKTMENQESSDTFIPTWFKNDASWWYDGSISDEDFGLAIKYLVDSNIIRV